MGRLGERYRTAWVTGASSGLGRAFADMLVAEGVRVWGTSRSLSRLSGLAAAHPGTLVPVELDLCDRKGAVEAYRKAEAEAGGAFDLVIGNAGFGVFGEFEGVASADWLAQVDAMLGTTLALSHAAYASMRGRGRGTLVHVSSLAAEFPIPYLSGYNVAKAGLSALSESLVFETRGTPVRVIDFRPGDYRTDFNRAMHRPNVSETTARAWDAIERALASGPEPRVAAEDLRRALVSGRVGIVRSGSFFQARLAPLLARIAPTSWFRAGAARYYGL